MRLIPVLVLITLLLNGPLPTRAQSATPAAASPIAPSAARTARSEAVRAGLSQATPRSVATTQDVSGALAAHTVSGNMVPVAALRPRPVPQPS